MYIYTNLLLKRPISLLIVLKIDVVFSLICGVNSDWICLALLCLFILKIMLRLNLFLLYFTTSSHWQFLSSTLVLVSSQLACPLLSSLLILSWYIIRQAKLLCMWNFISRIILFSRIVSV